MKKIGILTMFFQQRNIGGLLQCYALTYFLRQNGYQAEQILFNYKVYDTLAYPVYRRFHPRKVTLSLIYRYIRNKLSPLRLWNIRHKLHIQNQVADKFLQQIPHGSQVYNNTTIKQTNKFYDIFVVGSDQIWHTDLLPHFVYFGEFVHNGKKVVSYAASTNMRYFKGEEDTFVKKLSYLTNISVREKTLKEYIERITDKKATVVLDPTLLLSPKEWLEISNPKPVPQRPYIFCYFLGSKSVWQRQKAQEYAYKYGYEIIHLPYIMYNIRSADKYLKGQGLYDVGPKEFIALINGAQCVFTDSFHGMAFSINFGKNFYVFNRDDNAGPDSMNTRITDTLEIFGLTNRHITDKNTILDDKMVDFSEARRILEAKKQQSVNWLLDVLRD